MVRRWDVHRSHKWFHSVRRYYESEGPMIGLRDAQRDRQGTDQECW
ncbi:MAG: hypothetical protein NVSMB27_31090 [Ktedonobacteraceae bacterium]